MQNSNKKLLGIMVTILIVLLILAVVLLSVIIVSLVGGKGDVTTASAVSTTAGTVVTTEDPFARTTVITTGEEPTVSTTAAEPVTEPVTGSDGPVTSPDKTTEKPVTVTAPITTKPQGETGETTIEVLPDGSVVKKGSFTGPTDTKIWLIVDWEAVYPSQDSKTVTLTVRVYLRSYSIFVASRDNGTVSIAGSTTTYRSDRIELETNDVHKTLLTTRTMTLSKSSTADYSVDIDAAWMFSGTYSGVPIKWIYASGTIAV